MAARRVVQQGKPANGMSCPTLATTPIENTAEKAELSSAKTTRISHERVVRMLGYCLTLGTAEAWAGFSLVAAVRLDATERAALGFATLNSLDADQARMTAAAALDAAGAPLPAFLGHMDEAQFWAALASPAELEAYCLASFRRMAPARQAAFLRFVQGRAAA